ncbi:MAG: IS110 family transposase [Alphaproteobacteria bacterium]
MTHTNENRNTIPAILGIDLGKNLFHLHALDEKGKTLWAKAIKRENLIFEIQNFKSCIVGIEACGGSNYWHRTLSELGHEVRMITPQRAVAFREGQKNDKNDALAIAQAVMNPHTRLVTGKSLEQQEISSLHAMRNLTVRQRTQMINHMRGTLSEYGVICRKGAKWFENNVAEILQKEIQAKTFPPAVARGLLIQLDNLKNCRTHINKLNQEIDALSQKDVCQRLQTIPGVGTMISTMLYGHGGDVVHYETSSDFAASLGLVPRQHSTGGRQIYGGISKRGPIGIRATMIHGARSIVSAARKKRGIGDKEADSDLIEWGLQCYDRMGMNKATVAVANKMARIAWKVMKTPGEVFQPRYAPRAPLAAAA